MTRTSLFAVVLLTFGIGATTARANPIERAKQCFRCGKTRYSKLHTTSPVIYRAQAFLQKCIPYAYPPLDEQPPLPRYVRFPCQPVSPEESTVIYLNSIHRPSVPAPRVVITDVCGDH